MRSPEPPVLATWLLEHLLLDDRNEAVAGDLFEEFERRRSSGWYWRQVIWAILVGLSNAFKEQWIALTLQFAFTWVWTYYYDFYVLPLLRLSLWATAFEPHARIIWWILTRQPQAFWVVPVPVAMYLVIRKFRLRVFMCVLFIGLSPQIALSFALRKAVFLHNFFVAHVQMGLWVLAAWWVPNVGAPVERWQIREWCLALIASVPLGLAVWAAQLSNKRARARMVFR